MTSMVDEDEAQASGAVVPRKLLDRRGGSLAACLIVATVLLPDDVRGDQSF
jgi:hypothetical protein